MDRVEFVKKIVEQISDKKSFVLFGVSYGGLLAIKYFLKYPDKAKGIIIGGMPYYPGFAKIAKISRYIPRLKTLSKVLGEFDFLNEKNLMSLKIPVLLLYSTKDRLATLGMGRRISKLIPDSKLFTTNKYNHGWLLHRIDESGILKEIEKFMKEIA